MNAILVSVVTVTLLAALAMDQQSARIDAIKYYSGRVNASQFVEIMERDFRNIGVGVEKGTAKIIDYRWDESKKYFEFKSMVDTMANASPRQIRYEMTPAAHIKFVVGNRRDSLAAYKVVRYHFENGAYKGDGGSVHSITHFNITLLDQYEQDVSKNLENARLIDVGMIALSPLGEDESAGRFRWHTRYRPVNLALE
jgi:hypothetical protein